MRRPPRLFTGAATAALLVMVVLAAGVAHATHVRGLSMEAMKQRAHRVVRGVVADQEVVYDARWRRVYTISWVHVSESLRGDARPGQHIGVKQLGGELDGLLTSVAGTAELTLGSEVVLFTRTDGLWDYVVGMAQGAYYVHRDASGSAQLSRNVSGLVQVAPTGPARQIAPEQLTLDALRGDLRRAR